jgi:hypothetical protein
MKRVFLTEARAPTQPLLQYVGKQPSRTIVKLPTAFAFTEKPQGAPMMERE